MTTTLHLIEPSRGFDYEYLSVNSDWSDGQLISGIRQGGTIDRVMSTEKESGTIMCSHASELPDDGRIRIYANDMYTGRRFPVATMRVTKPTSSISSATGTSSNVNLLSVLTYASKDMPAGPYVLAAGTNIVEAVSGIFTSLGMKVDATPSAAVLASDVVYEDKSWLEIANDLLTGIPNYASAYPDRMGTVMLRPYFEPYQRSEKAHFSDIGEDRVKFIGELEEEDNWFDVPNRLELVCETPDATYRSVASDTTGSRLSYDSRGYWVTVRETIDEVPETGIQDYMDARAGQMLRAKQSNVAAFEFTGQYVDGVELSDVVGFDWTRHGISAVRSVYSMTIKLTRSMLVDYRIREYMRGDG